jgi:4'-phosphopantetheinyl transferase
MPLIRNTQLSESVSLGIWKIEETADELRNNILLGPEEARFYESLRSDLRKRHWLSYRNILAMMPGSSSTELYYDEYGKPHPAGKEFLLSVTHSGIYSAAIVSYDGPVGIDIEMLKQRVERVKERFLTKDELAELGEKYHLEKLYIYWGAKEALYKLHGKPDVEFARDIRVAPFTYEENGKGTCPSTMMVPEGNFEYSVFYEKIDDYMLVFATKRDVLPDFKF